MKGDKGLKIAGIGLAVAGFVVSVLAGAVGNKKQQNYIDDAVDKAVDKRLGNK